jgi:hypothetical protein
MAGMKADLRSILTETREMSSYSIVSPHWDDTVASIPDTIVELQPEEIDRLRSVSGVDEDGDEQWRATFGDGLRATAISIQSSSALTLLYWHAVQTCYSYLDVSWFTFSEWPTLGAALGEKAPLFYVLVALAMVPRTAACHRELGIPAEITRAALRAPLPLLQRYCAHNNGMPGIYRREVGWLRYTARGELFRVGRFEYMHKRFDDPFHAYRNMRDGRVVLLAAHGSRFTALGYSDARPVEGDPGWWESHRIVNDRHVRGFPIDPRGQAVPNEVVLDRSEWKEVVVPKETSILDVHIPGGGGMTPDAVKSSLRDATSFFERYFPEKTFAAFRCESWILGPQLEDIFPADANLVRFLREVYLYPMPSRPFEGLFFIYSDDTLDERSVGAERLTGLPERTTLQARVKEYLESEKPWRGGGMILLRDDIENYGAGWYRSHSTLGPH